MVALGICFFVVDRRHVLGASLLRLAVDRTPVAGASLPR